MENVFDFTTRRNWKGALKFYLVTLIVTIVLVFALGFIYGIFVGTENVDAAETLVTKLGQTIAIVLTAILGALILRARKQFTHATGLLLVALGLFLSVVAGLLGGLLPLAILLTRPLPENETLSAPDSNPPTPDTTIEQIQSEPSQQPDVPTNNS